MYKTEPPTGKEQFDLIQRYGTRIRITRVYCGINTESNIRQPLSIRRFVSCQRSEYRRCYNADTRSKTAMFDSLNCTK